MGAKKTGRRTVQLTLTIDKEVMEKVYDFYNQTRDMLWLLPKSTLISYILDWALSQKNVAEGVIGLLKAKYVGTYQAHHKEWFKRKFSKS